MAETAAAARMVPCYYGIKLNPWRSGLIRYKLFLVLPLSNCARTATVAVVRAARGYPETSGLSLDGALSRFVKPTTAYQGTSGGNNDSAGGGVGSYSVFSSQQR